MADTPTTANDVKLSFRSHPLTKYAFPEGLENQWLIDAIGVYENEISISLDYDNSLEVFGSKLHQSVIVTLGQLMYCSYLTRVLDRVQELNGYHGRDLSVTGSDASKHVISENLQRQIDIANDYLNKHKSTGFG